MTWRWLAFAGEHRPMRSSISPDRSWFRSITDPLLAITRTTPRQRETCAASAVDVLAACRTSPSTAAAPANPETDRLRGRRVPSDFAPRQLQTDDRDDAACHGGAAASSQPWPPSRRYFNVAAPIRPKRRASPRRGATHFDHGFGAAVGLRAGLDVAGTDHGARRTIASGTTSMSPDLVRGRIPRRAALSALRGEHALNCGYGEGFCPRGRGCAEACLAGRRYFVRGGAPSGRSAALSRARTYPRPARLASRLNDLDDDRQFLTRCPVEAPPATCAAGLERRPRAFSAPNRAATIG